jgi:hypothetical protein
MVAVTAKEAIMVRSPEERKHDTLSRLEHDIDAWVATAAENTPYLVPLSFLWDGHTLLFATPTASPTARNLLTNGRVRIGIGPTRDLVLLEGTVEGTPAADLPTDIGDAFAEKTGFDPRELTSPYTYLRVRPVLIQAWREADELTGRTLMRNGVWTI